MISEVINEERPTMTVPVMFTSREEAYQTLKLIAEYLQRIEPHSPVPYLLQRAHVWATRRCRSYSVNLSAAMKPPVSCGNSWEYCHELPGCLFRRDTDVLIWDGPAPLMVIPVNRVMLNGMPMANIMDNKQFVNIPPFAMCTNPANPTVAAATAAALGVLTPMPCIPCTVAPGLPAHRR